MNEPKIEGYWRSRRIVSVKDEVWIPSYITNLDKYPWPVPQIEPISPEFIWSLKKAEALASYVCYRGWSGCRVCEKANGSREYSYGDWKWPEGYMHYLVDHNVHPTPEFVAFIMSFL